MSWRAGIFLLLASICSANTARAVQPKHYTSPSGRFVLTVDPTARSGDGIGRYRMERDGATVWSAEQPFTLWDASVDDEGRVGGYSYDRHGNRDFGQFIVALFDAHGAIVHVDKTERRFSRLLEAGEEPEASGQFIDGEQKRYVVRTDEPDETAHDETWRVLDLASGQEIGRYQPKKQMPSDAALHWIIDVRPLSGTPLTLAQWYTFDDGDACADHGDASRYGTRFTLFDADYKPLWSLDLPHDYTVHDGDKARKDRLDDLRMHGAILPAQQAGHFAIHRGADDMRVEFAVVRTGKTWNVSEVSSTALKVDAPLPREDAFVAVPEKALRELGHIGLRGVRPTPPDMIDSLFDFAFDDLGRVGVLDLWCDKNVGRFRLAGADGKIRREVQLPQSTGECGSYSMAWVGQDRWIVTINLWEESGKVTAAWLDASRGTLTPLEAFPSYDVKTVAATHDGGFVLLGYVRESMQQALFAFDAQGRQRWKIEARDGSDPDSLEDADDVTVTQDGKIVLVTAGRNHLQVFGLDGTYRGTIDLAKAWHREPNYPSAVKADATGGVIVSDGHRRFVRMKLDGSVLAEFEPQFADGRAFEVRGEVRMARDGRYWTSDGHALLRLNAQGRVDHVLGEAPDARRLGAIAAIEVTRDRRIYALDRRSNAVHVFDARGIQRRLCVPAPADHAGELTPSAISVTDAGEVFVPRSDSSNSEFVRYAADCRRIGIVQHDLPDESHQARHSQNGTLNLWVSGSDNIYLMDLASNVRRKIERNARGEWLESPAMAGVAPDGGLALLSGTGQPVPAFLTGGDLTLYSANGDALRTWKVPHGVVDWAGPIAFDGTRVVLPVTHDREARTLAFVSYDTRGNAQFRFEPPSSNPQMRAFLIPSAGGVSELWLFDGKASIVRYALPE